LLTIVDTVDADGLMIRHFGGSLAWRSIDRQSRRCWELLASSEVVEGVDFVLFAADDLSFGVIF